MKISIKVLIWKENELLLVRPYGSKYWSLPGGKPIAGESDETCLRREIREELSILERIQFKEYGVFSNHRKQFRVYNCSNPPETYNPSGEISKYRWTSCPQKYKLSGLTRKVIKSLSNC